MTSLPYEVLPDIKRHTPAGKPAQQPDGQPFPLFLPDTQ
jgi:hypothetical protein